jgi:hypothetical protein
MGNGTARRATEEEVTAAMERSSAPIAHMTTEQLLAGYRLEPAEGGGYDVFDAGGVKISTEDKMLRNRLEAEEFVVGYSRRVRGLPEADLFKSEGSDDGDAEYGKSTVEELKAMADQRGLDSSSATKKADWIKLLERDDKVKAALAAGDLEVLNIAELKKVAADRHIDLGDSTAKADLIGKIKGDAPKATA